MRKQSLVLLCLAGLALLAGCNNENITPGPGPVTPPEQPTDTATVLDLGNVSLSLSELPFGADTDESTRAQEPKPKIDTIDLCDGVSAEVTLEREKLPATRTKPQALPNGNYHLFIYKGTSWRWIRFTMQAGRMISHTGKIQVEPGVYDFYCCNEAVTFHRDQHQFEVLLQHAGLELFGTRKGVTISGDKNNIFMHLTRLSARVKTRVSAMMDFQPGFATTLLTADNIAGGMVYDIQSGNFIPNIPRTLPERTDSYVAAPDVAPDHPVYQKYGVMKSIVSSDYRYVFMDTPANKLYIKFQGHSPLYDNELYKFGTHRISTSVGNLVNGASYIFHIRLLPHFKYLYNDGTVGYLKDKGNRIPLALALNDHLGIALYDAARVNAPNDFVPGGTAGNINSPRWSNTVEDVTPIHPNAEVPARCDNDVVFSTWQEAIGYTTHGGQYWTWNPNGTRVNLRTPASRTKGDNLPVYPAFGFADHYRLVMQKKCQDAGLPYDANLLAHQGRWFLPSLNEWMWFLQRPGMSSYSKLTEFTIQPQPTYPIARLAVAPYYSNIVSLAFTEAGGDPPFKSATEGHHYWTSSEVLDPTYSETDHLEVRYAFIVTPTPINQFYLSPETKRGGSRATKGVRVRSFVSF